MTRFAQFTTMASGALGALALLSACGDGRDDAQATEPAAGDTQLAEAAPPPPERAPAERPKDLPLTLDFSSDLADIAISFPPEVAFYPALYDELREEAEAEADEVRRTAAEDAQYAEQNGYPVRKHSLEISWTTEFAGDAALSLLKTTFVFEGGAHPNTYYAALNWRPDTGAEFGIADLIADRAGFEAVSDAARESIMAEKRERMGEGLSDADYSRDQMLDATAPTPGNFEPFTLIPAAGDPDHIGGITLHYSPYELGPYVEGAYHVVLPQAVFADHAAAPFAAMLSGAPE